jgi:hypothetical protein
MSDASLVVTKLDAAKRQLRTAIELWFADADPVSVHTLAAAAHEIVHTLYRRKGLSGLMFDSPLIRDDMRSEFARRVKAISTFFKHAQRDADETLSFNPVANETHMLFATYGLHLMGESHEITEKALIAWFMLHEPQFFERNVFAQFPPIEGIESFRNASRKQFFEIFKLAYRDGHPVTHTEIIQAIGGHSSNN